MLVVLMVRSNLYPVQQD